MSPSSTAFSNCVKCSRVHVRTGPCPAQTDDLRTDLPAAIAEIERLREALAEALSVFDAFTVAELNQRTRLGTAKIYIRCKDLLAALGDKP